MVLGLSGVGGDFTLPRRRPERILFVSGGSGITPVLAMLRTLTAERADGAYHGDIAFIHYARTPAEACYRDELAVMPGVRVLHGYTRSGAGDLCGRFGPEHMAAAMSSPEAVFVCGPEVLVDAVRRHCPAALSESFVGPATGLPAKPSGGRVKFAGSDVEVTDDGRPLLEQAEAAGLTPPSGCRMGICHTCTRRKTAGVVRNLTTGSVSTNADEDVQICVSVPVGDVEIAL
jgi:ferredoxin-NADP reductase